jgi:hypothetical protein
LIKRRITGGARPDLVDPVVLDKDITIKPGETIDVGEIWFKKDS